MKQINMHDNTYRVTVVDEYNGLPERYCDLMWKYSSYGALKSCTYNHHFQKAVELIGQLHSSDTCCDPACSDYHNGINYIAKEASVSKQEVKALKKTYKKSPSHQPIYTYKSSYHTDKIINTMVSVLKANASSKKVKVFLAYTGEATIRDAILGPQYQALMDQKNLLEHIDNLKQAKLYESANQLSKLK